MEEHIAGEIPVSGWESPYDNGDGLFNVRMRCTAGEKQSVFGSKQTSSRVCVFSMLLEVHMQAPPMYFGPSFFAGGALSGRLGLSM